MHFLMIAFTCFQSSNLATKHAPINFSAFMSEQVSTPLRTPQDLPGHINRLAFEPRLGIPTIAWITKAADAAAKSRSHETQAKNYLSMYRLLYGYTTDTLNTAQVKYIHDLGKGPIVVKFEQSLDGIGVYGAQTSVLMDRHMNLQGITGYLFPHEIHKAYIWNLNEMQAIATAFTDLTHDIVSADDFVFITQKDEYLLFDFREGTRAPQDHFFITPSRIKPVFYGTSTRLIPAYYLEVDAGTANATSSEMFAYVISAEDGQLLERTNLTVSDSYTYRVMANGAPGFEPWDGPQGNGGTPHPTGMPDGFQEPFQSPALVTLQNLPFSMNDPWLPPAATETVGNNVDAYIDRFGGDGYSPGSGDFRAAVSSPGTFDYTYDFGLAPTANTTQQNAAITQLFYVCNYLHDDYYDAGFNEAAGNAQADNFGRGGNDSDSMRSECQDGTGTNNANMSTPSDGARPRMQMFVFTGPTPDRDGTIDNGISGHEWGHYWHHRLVPVAGNRQSGAMSEGWGDVIALIMAVEEGDNLAGAYASGAYATRDLFAPPAFVDNFYFGIRRFPYSVDMTKNPLTFGHIDPTFGIPGGAPISPLGWENNGNAEVHNAGEVWCQMIWECYHDLLVAHSMEPFQDVKNLMQTYLVTSLKLSPSNPTYTEARDALLMAAYANDPADFSVFSNAFARRGMGETAVSPPRDSTTLVGVVEDYNPVPVSYVVEFVSAELDDSINSCDNDGILDAGETGLLQITLKNSGIGNLDNLQATMSSLNDVSFSNGGVMMFGSTAAGDSVTGSIEVTLNSAAGQELLNLDISYEDTMQIAPQMTSESWVVHFDRVFTRQTDDAEGLVAWDVSVDTGTQLWSVVEDGFSTSGTHAYFVPDITTALDSFLTSPAIDVNPVGDFTFSFNHRHSFESGSWDGGVLELSTDGINWIDIGASASPGYNGTITTNPASPITDRPAFVNNSPDWPAFTTVNVNLANTYAGQTVWIRFREGCDGAVGGQGWWLDDISFPTVDPLFPEPIDESGGIGSVLPSLPDWAITLDIRNLISILGGVCI
ncbi:MAG: M36 family metallopeptidase [Acidobacteria bacterium]|nr:M36 family metallopeptidase [Acidobacteriota bacterium]